MYLENAGPPKPIGDIRFDPHKISREGWTPAERELDRLRYPATFADMQDPDR